MKVTKVAEVNHPKHYNVFDVTTEPNWLERLFGKKERTIRCRWSGDTYMFGTGDVYYDQTGKTVKRYNGIGEAIDNYRKKW